MGKLDFQFNIAAVFDFLLQFFSRSVKLLAGFYFKLGERVQAKQQPANLLIVHEIIRSLLIPLCRCNLKLSHKRYACVYRSVERLFKGVCLCFSLLKLIRSFVPALNTFTERILGIILAKRFQTEKSFCIGRLYSDVFTSPHFIFAVLQQFDKILEISCRIQYSVDKEFQPFADIPTLHRLESSKRFFHGRLVIFGNIDRAVFFDERAADALQLFNYVLPLLVVVNLNRQECRGVPRPELQYFFFLLCNCFAQQVVLIEDFTNICAA